MPAGAFLPRSLQIWKFWNRWGIWPRVPSECQAVLLYRVNVRANILNTFKRNGEDES